MVTTILNADPAALKAIKVPGSAALSQILPALAIGESLSFTVRQNAANGRGLISLGGQQLSAELPVSLKAGDVVEAQIAETGDALVLKIANVLRPQTAARPTLQEVLARSLEELTRIPKNPAVAGSAPPLTIDEALSHHRLTEQQVNRVLSVLGEAAELQDPHTVLSHVVSAVKGETAGPLKEAAAVVKQLVAELERPADERVGRALHIELIQLQKSWPEQDVQGRQHQLERLITNLEKHLSAAAEEKSPAAREALSQARTELKQLASQAGSPRANEKAEELVKRLGQQFPPLPAEKTADSATLSSLQNISLRLEQLAATQEVLSQLNPVMQALGEPALVLFPFLFQGFLTHSHVTLEPRRPWGAKTDEDGKKASGGNGEPYQRIQLRVPLPSLGDVGVDVAHRSQEILVRITAPEIESAGFIESRLEGLAERLRTIGFESSDLAAVVGEVHAPVPEWSLGDGEEELIA